jgi:hypothetical protein
MVPGSNISGALFFNINVQINITWFFVWLPIPPLANLELKYKYHFWNISYKSNDRSAREPLKEITYRTIRISGTFIVIVFGIS